MKIYLNGKEQEVELSVSKFIKCNQCGFRERIQTVLYKCKKCGAELDIELTDDELKLWDELEARNIKLENDINDDTNNY